MNDDYQNNWKTNEAAQKVSSPQIMMEKRDTVNRAGMDAVKEVGLYEIFKPNVEEKDDDPEKFASYYSKDPNDPLYKKIAGVVIKFYDENNKEFPDYKQLKPKLIRVLNEHFHFPVKKGGRRTRRRRRKKRTRRRRKSRRKSRRKKRGKTRRKRTKRRR
tara:strand:+ start:913 stop:1389 length:477 start_codon:yes stop_codon:yes gene_type:complete